MKVSISLPKGIDPLMLSGVNDINIRIIESNFRVKVYLTDSAVIVVGDEENVKVVKKVINTMIDMVNNDKIVSDDDMNVIVKQYKSRDLQNGTSIDNLLIRGVVVSKRNRMIKPKTLGQAEYMKAIEENDIVFGIGPAGTGKTYLATAMALNYLYRGIVSRIILTRPAVEAGESLGFLPGNLEEKVNPYLRPLYDSLFDMMGPEEYFTLMEKNVIEIAPLAFMRGRTLNNSFIILDEAQNTTKEQMKMFLTRLGFGSKMVITGDITQSDLPKSRPSGLLHAKKLFENIEGIKIVYLTKEDVVRHDLVKKIIELYEKDEENEEKNTEK